MEKEIINKIKQLAENEEMAIKVLEQYAIEKKREMMRNYQNNYYAKYCEKINDEQKKRYKQKTETTDKKPVGRPRKFPKDEPAQL
jgi:hypothetical protein